jgi:hypothetical protein
MSTTSKRGEPGVGWKASDFCPSYYRLHVTLSLAVFSDTQLAIVNIPDQKYLPPWASVPLCILSHQTIPRITAYYQEYADFNAVND